MKTVVVVTDEFPTGGITEEAFLRPEPAALARKFDRVLFLPLKNGGRPLALPEGIDCDLRIAGAPARAGKLAAMLSPCVWLDVIREIPYFRRPADVRHALAFAIYTRNLEKKIRRWIAENEIDLSQTLFYTFWFNFATSALTRIPGAKVITRAHGYDIYNRRPRFIGKVARRRALARLAACFPASDAGRDYLAENYPEYAGKIMTSRLGTASPLGENPSAGQADDEVTLLSCARLHPVKGVARQLPLIAEWARRNPGIRISWICIGEGEERQKIERLARNLPSNVTPEFLGVMPNAEVHGVLAGLHIDAEILTSISEGGCPLSLAEAMSYGIPVIACAVGGVPEIVTTDTGELLSAEPSPDEFCRALDHLLENAEVLRRGARRRWAESFEADSLRREFAEAISSAVPADGSSCGRAKS